MVGAAGESLQRRVFRSRAPFPSCATSRCLVSRSRPSSRRMPAAMPAASARARYSSAARRLRQSSRGQNEYA
jgi:hypothetical protein